MKYRNELLTELKSFPYFDKKTVSLLAEKYNLVSSTIDSYILKFLRNKDIFSLKKGVYVTSDFYEKNISHISYKFHIANILRRPSYISTWSALQYYGLVPESIMSITSVTTKPTRTYSCKLGGFIYNSIKKDLFHSFSLVEKNSSFF